MQATRAGLVEQRVLEALAARRCPRLVAALAAADAPLASLAAPWFPALFAGALPAETVARVWDCLMLEGPKVLFRVALALATVRRTVSGLSEACVLDVGDRASWPAQRGLSGCLLPRQAGYGARRPVCLCVSCCTGVFRPAMVLVACSTLLAGSQAALCCVQCVKVSDSRQAGADAWKWCK